MGIMGMSSLCSKLSAKCGFSFCFQLYPLVLIKVLFRDRSGNLLRVRPHWAKEFPRKVGGVPINDYMRQIYSTQLPAYVQGMRRLVEEKNEGDLSFTLAMFNTKYMENILDGYL